MHANMVFQIAALGRNQVPFRISKAIIALSSGALASGCTAGYAVPMIASGILGGTGTNALVGDGSIEPNPSLRMVPDLGDPQLGQWQAALRAARNSFPATGLQSPDTVGPGQCTLDEDAVWKIATGLSQNAFAGILASSGRAEENAVPKASLLQGECIDGTPAGNFIAVSALATGTATIVHHVTGSMKDGLPDGQWIRHTGFSGGQPTVSALQRYDANERETRSLTISGSETDAPSASPLITSVISLDTPGMQQVRSWTGAVLSQVSFNKEDGTPHGWTVRYPVQYNQRRDSIQPPAITYSCFQNGQPAPESACGAKPSLNGDTQ